MINPPFKRLLLNLHPNICEKQKPPPPLGYALNNQIKIYDITPPSHYGETLFKANPWAIGTTFFTFEGELLFSQTVSVGSFEGVGKNTFYGPFRQL